MNGKLVEIFDTNRIAGAMVDALWTSTDDAWALRHVAARTALSGYRSQAGIAAFEQVCLDGLTSLEIRCAA